MNAKVNISRLSNWFVLSDVSIGDETYEIEKSLLRAIQKLSRKRFIYEITNFSRQILTFIIKNNFYYCLYEICKKCKKANGKVPFNEINNTSLLKDHSPLYLSLKYGRYKLVKLCLIMKKK